MTNYEHPLTHTSDLPDVFLVLEEGRTAPRVYVRAVLPNNWYTSIWDGSRWKFNDNVGDATALDAFNHATWAFKGLKP